MEARLPGAAPASRPRCRMCPRGAPHCLAEQVKFALPTRLSNSAMNIYMHALRQPFRCGCCTAESGKKTEYCALNDTPSLPASVLCAGGNPNHTFTDADALRCEYLTVMPQPVGSLPSLSTHPNYALLSLIRTPRAAAEVTGCALTV